MCVCVCWGCGGHCRRNKILLCFAYQHIILTLSIFWKFLNNISFTGGPEEAQGGQHGGGAVQPHEVPPLHRDVEEGGDRGLVLLLLEVLLGPSTAQSGHWRSSSSPLSSFCDPFSSDPSQIWMSMALGEYSIEGKMQTHKVTFCLSDPKDKWKMQRKIWIKGCCDKIQRVVSDILWKEGEIHPETSAQGYILSYQIQVRPYFHFINIQLKVIVIDFQHPVEKSGWYFYGLKTVWGMGLSIFVGHDWVWFIPNIRHFLAYRGWAMRA